MTRGSKHTRRTSKFFFRTLLTDICGPFHKITSFSEILTRILSSSIRKRLRHGTRKNTDRGDGTGKTASCRVLEVLQSCKTNDVLTDSFQSALGRRGNKMAFVKERSLPRTAKTKAWLFFSFDRLKTILFFFLNSLENLRFSFFIKTSFLSAKSDQQKNCFV